MNRAERFEYLMNVIDYWTEAGADRYAGPFRYLKEGVRVREICVTPGCSVSVAQLKSYLATAVLEIYPWNNGSKVSWRDIRRALFEEEAAKKYSFFYERLDDCFSPEENRAAAKRLQVTRIDPRLAANMEEGETVPLCLLERVQEMARTKMGEYWKMCDPDVIPAPMREGERVRWKQREKQEPEEEEETQARKQNQYMECFTVIALHEIFVTECERTLGILQREKDEKQNILRIAGGDLDVFPQALAAADEEGQRTLLRKMEEETQEVLEAVEWLSKYTFFKSVYFEHLIGIGAELLLAMFLETKNVEEMRRDVSLGRRLTRYLECMAEKSTGSFVRYNKNRSRYYRQLEADVEDCFFRYMESVPRERRQDLSGAVERYLSLVRQKRRNEEEQRELWEAQSIMVTPLWVHSPE